MFSPGRGQLPCSPMFYQADAPLKESSAKRSLVADRLGPESSHQPDQPSTGSWTSHGTHGGKRRPRAEDANLAARGRPVASFFGHPPLKPGLKSPFIRKEYPLLQRRVQL